MDIKDIANAGSSILTGISKTDGIITTLYKSHMQKYTKADDYLASAILRDGSLSDEDIEIAARLYAIPMLHKQYKNIAKTMSMADLICDQRTKATGEKIGDVDDDWFSYFIDRASLISEESVQATFAYVLTQECCSSGSIRKVMLDRLALLDKKSAYLFSVLCTLTYSLELDDSCSYSIPLYLRDDVLQNIVNSSSNTFTEEQAIAYQACFSVDGDPSFRKDIEGELEILQEIGFIKLSEDGDEGDIYSTNPCSFTFMIEDEPVEQISLYDEKNGIYYVKTGNVVFTKMGLDLFHSIKNVYRPHEALEPILKAYIQYQKNN